jgi:structural maintenance of chromosome 3 (chondroitin sulfate proteoglycan 6)
LSIKRCHADGPPPLLHPPCQLLKRLHKVKTALGKFSHVNKKALQMYEKYSAQRDDIYARFTEMEKSAESIHELIRNLDKKKDAAIENTFGEVSKHFGEIFEKLVPAGRGRLVMNRRADNAVRAQPRPVYNFFVNLQTDLLSPPPRRTSTATRTRTTSGQRSTATLVSRSRLVQLSLTLPVTVRPDSPPSFAAARQVSFNSKSDEGLRIQQLSGGQKALVALALVFSIQRCDPAPFYLFDEIDANLDAQYRTSVASASRPAAIL